MGLDEDDVALPCGLCLTALRVFVMEYFRSQLDR